MEIYNKLGLFKYEHFASIDINLLIVALSDNNTIVDQTEAILDVTRHQLNIIGVAVYKYIVTRSLVADKRIVNGNVGTIALQHVGNHTKRCIMDKLLLHGGDLNALLGAMYLYVYPTYGCDSVTYIIDWLIRECEFDTMINGALEFKTVCKSLTYMPTLDDVLNAYDPYDELRKLAEIIMGYNIDIRAYNMLITITRFIYNRQDIEYLYYTIRNIAREQEIIQ